MDLEQYKLLHARHVQLDTMVWQTPTLAIAGMAFLLTAALREGHNSTLQAALALIACAVGIAAIHSMAKHRHVANAVRDRMVDFEMRTSGYSVLHTQEATNYKQTPNWFVKISSFRIWMSVLTILVALSAALAIRSLPPPHAPSGSLRFDPLVDLGDIAAAAGLVIATFSLIQVWSTLRQGNRAMASRHYSELDRLYNDLIAETIERPFLRRAAPLSDDEAALSGRYEPFPPGNERDAYENYAQMVWCFVETLHDRAVEIENAHDKAEFISTWATAIDVEDRFHRGWFLTTYRLDEKRTADGERGPVFRREFSVFAVERQWRTHNWKYRTAFSSPPRVA